MAEDPAVGSADAPAGGTARRARKANSLANRIKRLMQTDEDVGKIAQASPALIGRALELFLGRLCGGAHSVAQQYYTNTIAAGHLKAAVAADPTLDFLKDVVAEAPDLPEPPQEPPARVARQRKKAAAAAADDGDAEAASPSEKAPRKPRARKRKPASGDDDEGPDAVDGSDFDPDDEDGAGSGKKKRQRKRAAPRKPKGAAAAAAVGSDDAAAPAGRAKSKPCSKLARAVELDEEPLDADEDEAVGGWHVVSYGAAAAPEPMGAMAEPGSGHVRGDADSGQTDTAAPPTADAAPASDPKAAAVKPEAGAAPPSSALPAFAYAGTHLVSDVEEDDYDAD